MFPTVDSPSHSRPSVTAVGKAAIASNQRVRVTSCLRRRAKARAALEGTTLSQVVRERLEEFAAGWDATEEADDARAVEEIEARIARGEEKLRDWADVEAELGALQD